jgi:hypothetical protein
VSERGRRQHEHCGNQGEGNPAKGHGASSNLGTED